MHLSAPAGAPTLSLKGKALCSDVVLKRAAYAASPVRAAFERVRGSATASQFKGMGTRRVHALFARLTMATLVHTAEADGRYLGAPAATLVDSHVLIDVLGDDPHWVTGRSINSTAWANKPRSSSTR